MQRHLALFLSFFYCVFSFAQTELSIQGDVVYVGLDDTLFIGGDIGIGGNTGQLLQDSTALIEVKGDWQKNHPNIQQKLAGLVRFSGGSAQTIISAGNGDLTGNNTYFSKLEIDNAGALVSLSGCNIEVKKNLNFLNNSRLRTATTTGLDGTAYNQYVYVANADTNAITGNLNAASASYIEGRLRRAVAAGNSYDLPVGIDMTSSANNQVMTFRLNQGSGTIESAFTYDAGGAIAPIFACMTNFTCEPDHGYWTVTPISGLTLGGGSVDYDVILHPGYAASTCAGVAYVVLKDGTYSGSNICGNNFSTNFQSVPRYGFDSFSQFRIATSYTMLPIELLSFTGKTIEGVNHLYWTTSQEINSSHFELEHSINGVNFEHIKNVAAAGNSTIPKGYTEIDEHPYKSGTYYRLKLVDINGASTYSNIVFLGAEDHAIISLYPNPFTSEVSLYATGITKALSVKIYDAIGKLVYQNKFNPITTTIETNLPLQTLATGTYLYQIITDDKEFTGKLLKE